MTSSKQIQSGRPMRIPRSGHGAASVIPHLNVDDVYREPLQESMDDDDLTRPAEPKPSTGANRGCRPDGG